MAEKRRKHSVSVLLTNEEFQRWESFCDERGHKKSTLIARLIRDHLHEQQHGLQRQLAFPGERSA